MDDRLGLDSSASILTPEKIPIEESEQPKFIHVTCGTLFSIAIDDNNHLWYSGSYIGIGSGGKKLAQNKF